LPWALTFARLRTVVLPAHGRLRVLLWNRRLQSAAFGPRLPRAIGRAKSTNGVLFARVSASVGAGR